MTPHPSDPPAGWRALPRLAGLAADGVLTLAEADRALAATGPAGDASGWQARRRWALADGVAAARMERERTLRHARRALAPLLAARAPRAALEAAVAGLPAEQGAALLEAEITRVLRSNRR